MPAINKILVPIDLHDATPSALHEAAVLARHFDSEIVLLHVVTPLSYSAGAIPDEYVPTSREDLVAKLICAAEQHLDRLFQPELAGLRVKRILRQGEPAEQIAQVARDEGVSLIAMATHGYGTFRRLLLGSVTAKVLHDVTCPVWTGPHLSGPSMPDFAIRRVLCAIDLDRHSLHTASWAAWLAARFGACLTLIHVTAAFQVYGAYGADAFPEWNQELAKVAASRIADMQLEIGSDAGVLIESGDVPRVLSHAAGANHADLLVIGRRACGGRLGSTGYGIIRESQTPVLSV